MEDRIPVSGEFYRHFDGNIYQIKMIAKDSETGETLVVYQGMYPPFQCWVRSLEMFVSEVDQQKHPKSRQKKCFEHIDIDALRTTAVRNKPSDAMPEDDTTTDGLPERLNQSEDGTGKPFDVETVDDTTLVRALQSGQPERYLSGRITDREIAERGCMQILDAETFREKRQLMIGMKQYLDKRLLHNIAAALDIVLEEGDLESQYDSLLHCLDTMEHFEGGRLR